MFRILRRLAAWLGLPALAAMMFSPSDWTSASANFLLEAGGRFAEYGNYLVSSGLDRLSSATGVTVSPPFQPLILMDLFLLFVLVDAFAEFGAHSYWSHVIAKISFPEVALRAFVLWAFCLLMVAFLVQAAAYSSHLDISAWLQQLTGVTASPFASLDYVVLAVTLSLLAGIFFWHPGIGWRVLTIYAFVLLLTRAPDPKPFFDWLRGVLPTVPAHSG